MDNLLTGSHRQHRPHQRPALPLRQARRHQLHRGGRAARLRAALREPRLARSTTSSCPSRRSRSARSARTRRSGWPRTSARAFLLASTSEVYGDPLVHPQREDYWGNVNPVGPRGVYDEAKRFAEAMTMAYHRVHGVDTRIVRIFNTYGPRMRLTDGRAIPTFVAPGAARTSRSPSSATARQTRSFTLRHRPGRRHLAPHAGAGQRAGEHRQPAGDDAARARPADLAPERLRAARSCFRPLPTGRPQGAPARHQPSARRLLGVGAQGGRGGRACAAPSTGTASWWPSA